MGKKSRLKKLKQDSPDKDAQHNSGSDDTNPVLSKNTEKTENSEKNHSNQGRHYLGLGFILAAIGITIYLLQTTLTGSDAAGCGPDSNCNDVLSSKYAYLGPIPVSLLALPIYVLLALNHVFLLKGKKNLLWLSNTGTMIVITSALYFIGLQMFVLKSYCPYCITTHIFASISGVFGWRSNPPTPNKISLKPIYGTALFIWLLGVVSQELIKTDGDDLNQLTSSVTNQVQQPQNTPLTNAPSSKVKLRSERMVNTHGLDVENLPLIGRDDAKHIDIVLVDYTCKYCRNLHKTLTNITKQYPEKFAFIIAPMPLDAECNKTLAARGFRTQKSHIEACEYAKLAMALCRTDPKSFHWWDNEIMNKPIFPKYQESLKLAKEITNPEVLVSHLVSPWIQKQIDASTSIYGSHYKKYGKGTMPQLIIEGRPQFTPFTGNRVEQILKMSYREEFATTP